MAIVEMSKLNLVAMGYDRDAILNALQKTGATEIKTQTECENTVALETDCDDLRDYLSRMEEVLNLLSTESENYDKNNDNKSGKDSGLFVVSYSEFMSAANLKADMDALAEKVELLEKTRRDKSGELTRLLRNKQAAGVYSQIDASPAEFSDTAHVAVRVGSVPAQSLDGLLNAFAAQPLAACSSLAGGGESLPVAIAVHRSVAEEVLALLGNFGFAGCPLSGEKKLSEQYGEILSEEERLNAEIADCTEKLVALGENINSLKIYCDYLGFQLEKSEQSQKMRATDTTFLLEAYVPTTCTEQVTEAINGVTQAAYFEFSKPSEDEIPPTLYRNNEVVKNFESITNMYSPASSREFDPNTVMAVFYSIFLGFIMADIGYGLIMLLGGGAIYLKKRAEDGGLKRLAGVFAVGGIFAIVWGVLFNSFFGIALLPFTVMPNAQKDMWSVMGISVPAVLIISLIIGTFHLLVGYLCRAWQCWRRGKIWDGIWDGVVWALFSFGVILAIIGFTEQFNLSIFGTVGGIIAGASLAIAVLTAGRHEKFLGKFTKGFGAAYGVINYASDILSYARLYGLMLSGAVIASIISDNAINMITGGNVAFIIIGVLLMLIGHAFNLAISLLGAYIHDARLQYVEFYGRFFEGEGELFAPLGSSRKYINLDFKS